MVPHSREFLSTIQVVIALHHRRWTEPIPFNDFNDSFRLCLGYWFAPPETHSSLIAQEPIGSRGYAHKTPHLKWSRKLSLPKNFTILAEMLYYKMMPWNNYFYACNLIWWAVSGFQDVMKQQEIGRNKEKMTKKLRKKKPKTQQKPPRFSGGFWRPFLTTKLGISSF